MIQAIVIYTRIRVSPYTFEVHVVMNNISLTSFPKKVINLIQLYCINCAHSIYEYISPKKKHPYEYCAEYSW